MCCFYRYLTIDNDTMLAYHHGQGVENEHHHFLVSKEDVPSVNTGAGRVSIKTTTPQNGTLTDIILAPIGWQVPHTMPEAKKESTCNTVFSIFKACAQNTG